MGNAENKPDEDKPDANQARVDKVRVMKPAVKPAVTRPNAADVLEHHADEIMSLKPALACHVEEMVASRPHSKDDTAVTIVETLLVGFILGRDIGLDGVNCFKVDLSPQQLLEWLPISRTVHPVAHASMEVLCSMGSTRPQPTRGRVSSRLRHASLRPCQTC